MKVFNKNSIPLILMSFSIVLLLAFQLFWLNSVYKEQYNWLKKETDNVFHNTIRAMQDSLIKEAVILPMGFVSEDSAHISLMGNPFEEEHDFSVAHTALFLAEDSLDYCTDTLGERNVKIVVRGERLEEPQEGLLNTIILSIRTINESTPFVLDLEEDSISIDEVQLQYDSALRRADIILPFSILRIGPEQKVPSTVGLLTAPALADLPMTSQYLALFPEYEWYIFEKILPQLLFSVFLLAFTVLSFLLIYRNLQRQRKLIAMKNDLISNITHELKTPITTVSVAIEALNSFNALQNPERTQEYLDISKNELNRLSILVDKVLKMSIFENREPELKLEKLDLRELVQEILNSMKLYFEKFSAKVHFQHVGSDFSIEADKIHLTSVFYNLIDNALKYSQKKPDIHIVLSNSDRQLCLSVQDAGIGIEPEYREKIFEKFFRIPTGDRHNSKGYGLGLSYVASVIHKHNGSIEMESKKGVGSRFTVYLPKKEK